MLSEKQAKSFEKQQRKVEKIFLKNKKKGLAKAIRYCKKGNPYSALFLDDCMHHGMKLSTSLKEKTAYVGMSTILLKMAADAGHTLSQYKMAKLYEEGKLVPKNNRLAFYYFLQAAQAGDSVAQCNVGRYYALGIGTEQNAQKSRYWEMKSAEQGCSIAMINVANGYENGKGLPKDNNLAIEWYTRGLRRAQELLNSGGEGYTDYYEPNEQRAVDLANKGLRRMEIQRICEDYRDIKSEYLKEITLKKITKYAEEGEWRAQFELGLVHEKMKDYDGAIRWYEQASSNGSSGAMRNIGLIFYYGKGRGVDYQKAYEWFMKAINYAANTHAMYMVGEMFEKGIYVPKDLNTAISWYHKADIQGSQMATQKLKQLREEK